ncbi:winged helix-turn-helix transcriptional regulator [Candidatus Woesearchaeota archaeon]|nr:winged helix-turn-helix transcriptional regulator [Candidatus Woesearchaeota archaeon]
MKKTILLIVFVFCLFSITIVNAQKADKVDTEFRIIDNILYVEKTIEFDNPINQEYNFDLPEDARGISLYLNNKSSEYNKTIILKDISSLRINYLTNKFLDRNTFIYHYNSEFETENLRIILYMDERHLKEEISEGKGSIYPKPDETESDGKAIVFIWNRKYFLPEEEFSLLVILEPESNMNYSFLWITGIIILISTGIWFFIKQRGKKPKVNIEALSKRQKQIYMIVRKHKRITQSNLQDKLNLPKSSLSRNIDSMVRKGIIEKKKRGMTNLIMLKKD